MGREAVCTARIGKRASAGKLRLETEELVFRGSFRLDVKVVRFSATHTALKLVIPLVRR